MSIRSIILSQFEQVVKEQNKQLVPLTDDWSFWSRVSTLCASQLSSLALRMRWDLIPSVPPKISTFP